MIKKYTVLCLFTFLYVSSIAQNTTVTTQAILNPQPVFFGGGIVLGGTSATITEISTDTTLPANSDNVLVTQKAIKSYIASRIGGGGANLNVNEATAGQIKIATSNQITNTLGTAINFKNKVNFTGGVDGNMLATAIFVAGGR